MNYNYEIVLCLDSPLGIGIGIGITNVCDDNRPTTLIVEGVSINAASSRILIYIWHIVDLLAADFMNPRIHKSGKLLLVGACCMSLITKWA